ncbi:S23 ribosomal [Vibrio sp. JCM 19236]|nr:S23 ribosomal [Vibrio sp. JCM 19236]
MNFEKLDVWKRAARLSAEVYKETSELSDYGFRNQLTRAEQHC